jgi:hypothetical protein
MTRTSAQRDHERRRNVQKMRVQGVQCRPRTFPLEDGDLLSKSKDFEGRVATTADEDADCGKEREDE